MQARYDGSTPSFCGNCWWSRFEGSQPSVISQHMMSSPPTYNIIVTNQAFVKSVHQPETKCHTLSIRIPNCCLSTMFAETIRLVRINFRKSIDTLLLQDQRPGMTKREIESGNRLTSDDVNRTLFWTHPIAITFIHTMTTHIHTFERGKWEIKLNC